MFLLDINVLIALADPDHVHHDRAGAFFLNSHLLGWATCPLTENGFVRITSHPNYPKGFASADLARDALRDLCAHPGHQFWPDDISVRSVGSLPASKHLTDHYLLSLAVHRQGSLVTLDSKIDAARIPGGSLAYRVI
jgi:toxin-antitoxin system PIN domain toxin